MNILSVFAREPEHKQPRSFKMETQICLSRVGKKNLSTCCLVTLLLPENREDNSCTLRVSQKTREKAIRHLKCKQ